jgi:hypothetical protein
MSMELVTVRRVILLVLLLGMTGLLTELLLLGHYEDSKQWIPLTVVSAGLAALVAQLMHPRRWTLDLVRLAMMAFILTGLLGMYFHYRGSSEFQLEMDPNMDGPTLMWHVLRAKSPPTLSPGTLIQMGILGLGYAHIARGKGNGKGEGNERSRI